MSLAVADRPSESRNKQAPEELIHYLSLTTAIAAALAICLMAVSAVASQSGGVGTVEGNLLPPTTGEPLTVKPVDMHDVDCVVAQWDLAGSKPVLTLICPPQAVFAPLRVLLKFSWMKSQDAPVDPKQILARAGALTKVRTNRNSVLIWLRVSDRKGEAQESWVAFNAVVDVAMLPDRLKN